MNIDEINEMLRDTKGSFTISNGKNTATYVDGVCRMRIGDWDVINEAEASALSTLSTRVTSHEGKITAQGESIKSITNTVTQEDAAITPYHIQKPHIFPDMHAPAFIIQNGVVYIKQSCIKECTLKF